MTALPHLQKQLREMTTNPPAGFRIEVDKNIYQWTVWFAGPQDTPYEGGQYKAHLYFTKEFPMEPPSFRIESNFWHPNVYLDGRVCISILHPPGVDEMNAEESAMMRWTPVQTIRSVLISIISLLSDPDPKDSGAPANVDALVMYRKDRGLFNTRCKELAQKSLQELPPNYVPPVMDERAEPPQTDHPYYKGLVDEEDDVDEFDLIPSPSGSVSGPERYREELQQLRAMNIDTTLSDDELLHLLTECRGDIATVLEKLFS
ncbi:unnamed protein product [Phytomonas sp. Hart1]|nr:unnamed protein product [Phytomonas sp. Hart1]|eukprot:CCW70594.1 unnamed protein product [Phytomonas sp. isolate Hart1]